MFHNFKGREGAMLLKICFKKFLGDWVSPVMCLFHLFRRRAEDFGTWLPWETRQQLSHWSFLNAGFVEVNFHRQRPGLLTLLWLFHSDSDHRTQVVRVDFVSIIQKLFISVDTQLKRDSEKTRSLTTVTTPAMINPILDWLCTQLDLAALNN